MSLVYGASYYHFGNAENASLTLGSSSDFDDIYNIVELFGGVDTTMGEMPISVYGSYANNAGTNSSADTGWIVGLIFNKAKAPGSWQLGYNYRDVEADAVAGRLNDSDFIGGGTGGRGHEFKAAYQILKNVQTAITYIKAERDRGFGTDNDYDRIMADVILKF
ncbi:MAG: putative porin [Planctomycetota bacterium]